MKLSINEFNVLRYLEKNNSVKLTQRDLAKALDLSLGTINSVVSSLDKKNYVKYDESLILTVQGLKALEPYRVKRAVFLAAGFGSRMIPLTFNTPKPLIKVHGKSMIEYLLEAVDKAEIKEKIVVVGYLGEYFEVLKNKYPDIKLVQNDLYNDANNISSALMVKDYFENAYVLESDLVLYNPDIIQKYEYHSCFLGKYVNRTDDWCFTVKKDVIVEEKVGGTNCYHMYGISYYDKEDGKKLSKDIEDVYNMPGGKEKYWEQVPLVYKKDHYKVHIKPCNEGDIVEIDSFKELQEIDSIYKVL
ncbi:MAG: NTP transferase domain-containing protein [Firmicutes bacterium]|nr:NTP transferase domain-containing protein [Candidatus Colivicinus equi]